MMMKRNLPRTAAPESKREGDKRAKKKKKPGRILVYLINEFLFALNVSERERGRET